MAGREDLGVTEPRWAGEHGGVLLEFAISITVLWLIIAAALDLGRAFASAHVLQSAARSAARELALTADLPWNASFGSALRGVFDADYLVLDADCLEARARANDTTPETELASILGDRGLSLNQMLRPLMLFERVSVGGNDRHLLRYPGALLRSAVSPDAGAKPCSTGYTVGIPEVEEAQSRITMHGVVEEISPGSFRVDAGGTGSIPPGTVALRLLYPFQAAALTSWRRVDGRNQLAPAAQASDYDVEIPDLAASTIGELDPAGAGEIPAAYVLNDRGDPIPVYGGSLGLGFQAVLGRVVRPYRRVLSAQAIAARETLGAGP